VTLFTPGSRWISQFRERQLGAALMALSVSYLGQEDFNSFLDLAVASSKHMLPAWRAGLAFCGHRDVSITSHVHYSTSSWGASVCRALRKLVLNHSTLPPFLHAAIAGIRSEVHIGLGHTLTGEAGIYRIAPHGFGVFWTEIGGLRGLGP